MKMSLTTRHEELVATLLQLEGSSLVNVRLEGASMVGHTVDALKLSEFLTNLQYSVSSIAQAAANEVRRRGFSQQIRSLTGMRVAGTFAGSFGLRLSGPLPDAQQTLFPTDDPERVFGASVDTLLDVLQASTYEAPETSILESVLPLSPRAVYYVARLTGVLASLTERVHVTWHPSAGEGREVTLSKLQAATIAEILGRQERTETTRTVSGVLGGASLIRGSFELELSDGQILRGVAADELFDDMTRLFGKQCLAHLKVTLVQHPADGEVRENYELVGLE
jgi:hypothetical protein